MTIQDGSYGNVNVDIKQKRREVIDNGEKETSYSKEKLWTDC